MAIISINDNDINKKEVLLGHDEKSNKHYDISYEEAKELFETNYPLL